MQLKNRYCPAVAILISILGTSSCASVPEASTRNEQSSVGTQGRLVVIQSDNVQMAGYNDGTKVMTVQFKNGALYEYYGVPAELWSSFIAAQPHPWSQVGYPRLVSGGFPYKRVG